MVTPGTAISNSTAILDTGAKRIRKATVTGVNIAALAGMSAIGTTRTIDRND
jgi:hypothetical protein